jgi:hypothetical protein
MAQAVGAGRKLQSKKKENLDVTTVLVDKSYQNGRKLMHKQ